MRTYVIAFLICGAPRFVVAALESPIWAVCAITVVAGAESGFLNPILGAVILERIPAPLLGRVSSLNTALCWSLMPLGGILGGLAVTRDGNLPRPPDCGCGLLRHDRGSDAPAVLPCDGSGGRRAPRRRTVARVTPLFATSDAHGHLAELTAAVQEAGLVDADAHWAGGNARLWVLGDFMDRGPDGLGVIALVRRLAGEAPAASGHVGAVLGNHEVLALGMKRFGDTVVDYAGAPRTFGQSWVRNGGRASDQAGIDVELFAWLRALPMVVRVDDHLLMHSDNLCYLDWGRSIDEINRTAYDVLAGDDIAAWFDLLVRMTQRHAFHGEDGPRRARAMLDALGGEQIVHGHSIIGDLFDEPCDSCTEPRTYPGGLVLDIDGGIYEGGPCLVARLA